MCVAVCDLPQDKWSAAFSVRTVLMSLQSLLGGTLASIQVASRVHCAAASDANMHSLYNRSKQRQSAERLRGTAVGQHRGCAPAAAIRRVVRNVGLCLILKRDCVAEYKATLHKKYSEASEAPAPEAKA